MSSRNISCIYARKRTCSTEFGDVCTAPQRTQKSPPGRYRSLSLPSTGERFTDSDRVLADLEAHSTTHSHTGVESRSGLTSRQKTAPLKSRVSLHHHHRFMALENKEE